MPVEPGNQVGPTRSGTQTLIDQDPLAYWDAGANRVVSSLSPSPRIVVLPVYDPATYDAGKVHGRVDITITNLVGFFIESLQGNDVVGRVVPMTGLIRSGTPVTGDAFLRAIRLVN